jgi:hypothetical protein
MEVSSYCSLWIVFDDLVQVQVRNSDGSSHLSLYRNLWNFSPKHVFTDSSGMYWRERRLRPGMYTDGANVYEASYRYGDGRNGMRRMTNFQQFMASKSIGPAQKEKITKRLKEDVPDVVLEE